MTVVGAGPHESTAALSLLKADPGLTGRILVADPQPWLAAWDGAFRGRSSPGCVWLATGHRFDARDCPLTADLLQQVPVPLVDGLPVLEVHLSWGGTAVHVTGGLAALSAGPTARNLVGARIAAERWTGCVAGSPLPRMQHPAVGVGASTGAPAPAATAGGG